MKKTDVTKQVHNYFSKASAIAADATITQADFLSLLSQLKIFHWNTKSYAQHKSLTAVTIIETSHIAMHIWDEDDPAMMQLDVYTCGPLDPYDVVEHLAEFDPVLVEMKYLDREHNLVEIPLPDNN